MSKTYQVDISNSINSGQVFLWKKTEDGWYGIDGQNTIQINKDFDVSNCNSIEANFFRLDDDYDKIIKNISKDKIIKKGIKKYQGLRLLRQDPFQCYISFIVSSNSNIPNIKIRLQKICQMFGKKVKVRQESLNLFPEPKKIAKASIGELQSCGLGYRSKFVKHASEKIVEKQINLEELKKEKYYDVKTTLIQAPGIGNKVADCIMLFALEKLDSFPIDTWILKALQEFYPKKISIEGKSITEKKYEKIHQQVIEHFGIYAGYSQQFLFKLIRDQNHKTWL